MTKRILGKSILIVSVFIIYMLLDYVNFPTLMGIKIDNINMDIYCVMLDIVIVLILYLISFYYIENRQNEKDANARDMVGVLIRQTYKECRDNLKILDNREVIKEYIIPKIDGDKCASENKIVYNFQNQPFSSYETVVSLATNGFILKKDFEIYLEIKKEYQSLVNNKITFFDLINPQTEEQQYMYNHIEQQDKILKKTLDELLAKKDI